MTWKEEINSAVHEELMKLFKEYVYVGGLPEAVSSWIEEHSLDAIKDIHRDLLGSYRADFSKYGGKISPEILNEVIDAIPLFLGKKFVYSHVDSSANSVKIKEALNLLCQAKVSHKVLSEKRRVSRSNFSFSTSVSIGSKTRAVLWKYGLSPQRPW